MVVLVHLISRKEEEELNREFGKEYEDTRKSANVDTKIKKGITTTSGSRLYIQAIP